MTVFTRDWDTAYEASPAGTDAITTADDRIREVKVDVRETFEVEHGAMDDSTKRGMHTPGLIGVLFISTATGITAQIASWAADGITPPDRSLFYDYINHLLYAYNASTGNLDPIALEHSSLGGLTADDHSIYMLVAGTRAFTGVVSGITPTADAHLATKKYVDDAITAAVAAHVAALHP